MRRALTLAAACIALAAPVAATAGTQLRATNGFESFTDTGLDPTTVLMCWADDYFSEADTWTIRRAAGTKPPARDAPVLAKVPGETEGACYRATDLVTNAPYTFSITVDHGDGKGESEPVIVTVAARDPGGFVLAGGSSEKLPGSGECCGAPYLAVTGGDHRAHATYVAVVPGERYTGLYYSARGEAGWSEPELLAAGSGVQADVPPAANAGTVAVAWNFNFTPVVPGYRIRKPGAGQFGPTHHLPAGRIEAIALDRRGHLHVLCECGFKASRRGLYYRTNADGHWRAQRLSSMDEIRHPLLTYDHKSDRVYVVEQHGGLRIRLASKRASARKFGPFHELRATSRRHLIATSLASRGGRVTVGLESTTDIEQPYEDRLQGPMYLLTNGRLSKVPGTGANDGQLHVAASSRNRVLVAWRRVSPSWDREQQGIWTAESVRNRKTGRWSIRRISQRTSSNYDQLGALRVGAGGEPVISYSR